MKPFYYHWPWTHRQMRLLWYYVDDLGLTVQQADDVLHVAWVYGYLQC